MKLGKEIIKKFSLYSYEWLKIMTVYFGMDPKQTQCVEIMCDYIV